MAKDKKSTRSFDLDKGSKHSFDLEKQSTRTFNLKKDSFSDETAPVTTSAAAKESDPKPEKPETKPTKVPPTPTAPTDNGDGNDSGNKKTWLWIVLAIIVLAILAYFFISGGHSKGSQTDKDTTELVKDSTATERKDSITADSTSETTSSEVTPVETTSSNTNSESVVPKTSQSSVEPVPGTPQQSEKVSSTTDNPSATSSMNVDEQARQVIKGIYGNNPERRQKLGADYQAIQKRVNELMRQ